MALVADADRRAASLGLYIAAALARLHGGIIEVESELGIGTTFTAVLPRTRARS